MYTGSGQNGDVHIHFQMAEMSNDDALWARLLIKKMTRWDPQTKAMMKVYIDNRCVQIGGGTWLPPTLHPIAQTPSKSLPVMPTLNIPSASQVITNNPNVIYTVESPCSGYVSNVFNPPSMPIEVSAAPTSTNQTAPQAGTSTQNVY